MSRKLSRRLFLGAASATGLTLLTSRKSPGEPASAGGEATPKTLNVACCGVNGRGAADLAGISKHANVTALCDVDSNSLSAASKLHPAARTYADFRKMMDDAKNFDAVVVATPDHMHAPIAMTAIQLGKHVYCEKPIAHDLYEVRMLTEAARKNKVMTQMGNQAHSSDGVRMAVEWINAGAVGNVKEIHVWNNRPIWPQAFPMPTRTAGPPATLDWDLWLGTAPVMPYYVELNKDGKEMSPIHPFKWRGWWAYGTGALGDMGCHLLDVSYWACKLTAPTAVTAKQEGNTDYCGPAWSIIEYEFPAANGRGPIKLAWHDGGKFPPRPPELEPDRDLPKGDGGTLFIGDKGTMLMPYGTAATPRLIPESAMKEFKRPEPSIARVEGGTNGHHKNFVDACLGGKPAGSNFDHSGPLTEIVLLGNLAIRAGKRVEWDSANLKLSNAPELQHLVKREYRKGW